jgi:hypothetical protein
VKTFVASSVVSPSTGGIVRKGAGVGVTRPTPIVEAMFESTVASEGACEMATVTAPVFSTAISGVALNAKDTSPVAGAFP